VSPIRGYVFDAYEALFELGVRADLVVRTLDQLPR
jgi:hypothetical protein